MNNITEKRINPQKGVAALVLITLALAAAIAGIVIVSVLYEGEWITDVVFGTMLTILILLCCVIPCLYAGLKLVGPNEAMVLSLFGRYVGTIYDEGLHFVNPFCQAVYPKDSDGEEKNIPLSSLKIELGKNAPRRRVSTKLMTFVNGNQKVNDKLGNPIDISAVVIWKVMDATKAVLDVDNYSAFLSNQTDSIVRDIARLYPYDDMDDVDDEMTLRGSSEKIAEEMKSELQKRVAPAGIVIEDVRINQLAYAPEIASAMLQRQQATAVIAARSKIVEGAVGMVEMALKRIEADGMVELDDERKAQMVGNLMVVLCGNREVNPIVNTGSIY